VNLWKYIMNSSKCFKLFVTASAEIFGSTMLLYRLSA
jgi:hypothetical protein